MLGSVDENLTRLHKSFDQSDIFRQACAIVRRRFGINAFPLCIGMTSDGTTINSSRSRSETPLNMYLMNDVPTKMEMILLGYLPGDRLPYTDDELQKHLELQTDRGGKQMSADLVRMMKRKANTKYIYEVFKPLLDMQDSGMLVQIGKDPKKYLAVPIFTCFSGDNMELYKLLGSSYHKRLYKCRICVTPQVENISRTGKFVMRKDADVQLRSLQAGTSLKNRFLRKCQRAYGEILTDKEKEVNALNIGFEWEPNELYNLFQWPLPAEGHGRQLIGLHTAMVPDILHNFLKGSVQEAIGWTQSIMECVEKLDENFKFSLATLDSRLKIFPRRQALRVFREVWLSGGLSEHLSNTTSSKTAEKSSGFGSGNIPAWKLPSIAMQFLFSLGDDLLPVGNDWWIQKAGFCNPSRDYPVPLFNVQEVVKNALLINLEVWFWLSADAISEKNLATTLRSLIMKLRLQMVNLHMLKFHLTAKAFVKQGQSVSKYN